VGGMKEGLSGDTVVYEETEIYSLKSEDDLESRHVEDWTERKAV
jgi:hypothetical protein